MYDQLMNKSRIIGVGLFLFGLALLYAASSTVSPQSLVPATGGALALIGSFGRLAGLR